MVRALIAQLDYANEPRTFSRARPRRHEKASEIMIFVYNSDYLSGNPQSKFHFIVHYIKMQALTRAYSANFVVI